jgi:hypothetical protein
MKFIPRILISTAAAASLAFMPAPADAGQHHGGGGHSSGGHATAAPLGGSAPHASPSVRGPAVAHGSTGFRGAPPVYAQSRGVAVPRGSVGVRGGVVGVRGGVIGTRGFVGRPAFVRPYYAFRPRLSLGFGLWAGYPVAYPYWGYSSYYGYYGYPYGYAYPYPYDPYAYGYAAPSYGYPAPYANAAPQSSATYPGDLPDSTAPDTSIQPSAPSSPSASSSERRPGGVSFEITPDDAAVFVDGTYVGTAATFNPTSMPLGLIPGKHHIEIRASGYHTMTFDADVVPGQVIPYKGTLEPQ